MVIGKLGSISIFSAVFQACWIYFILCAVSKCVGLLSFGLCCFRKLNCFLLISDVNKLQGMVFYWVSSELQCNCS